MSKTALIAVDVQNDFLPGGALGAPEGDQIIEPLLMLADEVDYVVATRDWHPPDHVSFSKEPTFEDGSWPVHCVQESEGAMLHPNIESRADVIVSKGIDPEEEAYSGFDGTVDGHYDLSSWLHDHDVDHVYVGGLVDEYCVKATAIDARSDGFRTTLVTPASAALSEETGRKARQEMATNGVHVSDRMPRGDRPATRDEAVQEGIHTILDEAEDAEHANHHTLCAWYHDKLLPWFKEQAETSAAFTVVMPDGFMDDIIVLTIPEAQVEIPT